MVKFYKTPAIIQSVFSAIEWKVPSLEQELYLTFDDGPTPEVTAWVLNLLKSYNAKATFFCLGKNIEQEKALFERILAEGHSIGNHSYQHLKGRTCSNKKYFEDIEHARKIIPSKLFRPPYGSLRFSQYLHLKKKYKIVMWDLLSYDFDIDLNIEESIRHLKNKAKKGSIIVFHDSEKAFPQLKVMLPKLLAHWSKDYTFASLKAE